MADRRVRKHHWAMGVISLAVSGVLAFACTIVQMSVDLTDTLNESGESASSSLSVIMDEYIRAFEQFEQLIDLKISTGAGPDDIATYLKNEDSTLASIEGEDYDGIYLYYQGEYLYSWDTPLSEYEQNGYVATERPWYTGAKNAHGEINFSVPYRSFANEYLLSTISRMQPDGETVIAYDIKLSSVSRFVDQMNVVPGSTVLVADSDGNIIGSTSQAYDGGNYRASEEQFAADLEEAQKNLDESTSFDREKAQKAVDSVVGLKALVDKHRGSLTDMTENSGKLTWDFDCGIVGLAQGNDRFTTITLVPFASLVPKMLLIWAGFWLLFAAAILFVENLVLRQRAVREIRQKNVQLAQAVDAANAASAAKSQFLAQMSHEIRTPMNAVIGLTGIAKTEVDSPDKVSDCLTKIEGSSRILLGIINDVLDMSAIEGGKMKIDSASFDLRAMVTNLTTLFYGQARKKGIRFEVHLSGVTEEEVVGDELRLNQVLMNLLSNALKFTPSGGEINLMVQQASRSKGKVMMRFSVEDTGCGMSEEMLGRLFKPFEQGSAGTARKYGGSGLGLSIAKNLVEMMGGSLGVKSTLGEGTTFAADIPFGIDEERAAAKPIGDFSKIRILVIDDDEDSCEYSAVLLDRLGVRHDYVTSGQDALLALGDAEDNNDPYTLCLVDWRMPGMNGGELTKKIRTIYGEDAFIIIVSAYDLDEVESTGLDMGANYFIPKPLFQSTLFNALMSISSGDLVTVAPRAEADEFDFRGRRVLIAEDVVLNMEVAVSLLERVGIEVSCVEDGQQAVNAFEKSEPDTFDCILLDINMPVMDGYGAARAIRKSDHPGAATIPIYAMTANAFAEDVTAALDAGMNGHIAKPIEVRVLYRTLEEAFKATDATRAADKDESNNQ